MAAKNDIDTNDRIAAVLEKLAEQAPPVEIGYGHPKYQERLVAEGFKTEFSAPVYQNGKAAQARGLKPETVERAPQLRPGRYLNKLVDVIRDGRDRVHLVYPYATVADRMRFAQKVRDFDDLIDQIWTEMHAA